MLDMPELRCVLQDLFLNLFRMYCKQSHARQIIIGQLLVSKNMCIAV
jgi:hypothetical protein